VIARGNAGRCPRLLPLEAPFGGAVARRPDTSVLTHRTATLAPSDHATAFSEVYAQNHAVVHAYLRARVLDASDAEDLCQEVFYRGYRSFDQYDRQRDVRFWLIGIARNALREHVRRVRRRKEVGWTELCLELEETVAADSPYEDFIVHLPTCTGSLGDSARSALNWHYMAAMKLDEIAQRLARTLGAVKVLLVRARQALKRCIESRMKGSLP
jgi:RNA polymerase sigma-70 factor (ECF subfamily)